MLRCILIGIAVLFVLKNRNEKKEMRKTKKLKKTEEERKKLIDSYGRKLFDWLHSDPDYSQRLKNEGSANW